ncbi:MAG: hypothetical protein Q8O91_04075 [Candidatus Aminicenantes bacterium]|nr:hypothetical protein [Candidatus Aminicenantes bacterium]
MRTAKPGALTRDVNTRLSTAEADPQTKPALIRFANEDCNAWGPCRRPGRRRPRPGGTFSPVNSRTRFSVYRK